jgi:RHS repeat-associated protein
MRDQGATLISINETQFDSLGRAYRQSNPHTNSASTCAQSQASYWTETRFDALGRPTLVIPPGGSASSNNASYSYSLNTVTVTDPAGKARKSESDALGRVTKVAEPDVSDPTQLNKETQYTYNVLDLLTLVSYPSPDNVQSRTFSYDDMGRLIQQITPEAGTWGYAYDSYARLSTRTDARGVDTTYTYDGLNRLTQVSYDVSGTSVSATNTVTYTYGISASSNNNGRLTNISNTTVSDSFTYDAHGRITQDDRVIDSTTYTTQYQYNLAGWLTQITYPSGTVAKQDYDAVGRLSKLYKDATTTYADTFGYNIAGQVTGFNYGNGVAATFGYSSDQFQLTQMAYTKNSQDLLKLNYFYQYDASNCSTGSTVGNNGQIQCIKDNSNTTLTPGAGGRSVSYTYDALYRLKTAATSGSSEFAPWALSWTYDRYGNRTNQNADTGNPPQHHPVIDSSTNRAHGSSTNFCYDNNGNLLRESAPPCPSPDYIYDAENQLVQYGSAQYTLDGASLRVKKVTDGTTTVYIFSGTKVIAEYEDGAAVDTPTREYIYLGSQLLAKFEGENTTYYHHDHLSARVITYASGSIANQSGHFPFGENWYETSASKLKFTSYERDAESGNDYAIFRSYFNRFGRFSSPDPVPSPTDRPQMLNRYSYVGNDPVNAVDPQGLLCGLYTIWYLAYYTDTGQTIANTPVGTMFFGPCDIGRPGRRDPEGGQNKKNLPGFLKDAYEKCASSAFGSSTGNIPGTNKSIPGYDAALNVFQASLLLGIDAATIAITMVEESNSDLYAKTGENGDLSRDVGPMQINTLWANRGAYVLFEGSLADSNGNIPLRGEPFAGNPLSNIMTGALYLRQKGAHPERYTSEVNQRNRLKSLNKLRPSFKSFFDCLGRNAIPM